MPPPWERYQQPQQQPAGPWQQYGAQPEQPSPTAIEQPPPRSRTEAVMRTLGLYSPVSQAEAALSIGTGMVAAPINEAIAGMHDIDPRGFSGEEILADPPVGTYQPRSQGGQDIVKGLSTVFSPLNKGIELATSPAGRGILAPQLFPRDALNVMRGSGTTAPDATSRFSRAAIGVAPGLGRVRTGSVRAPAPTPRLAPTPVQAARNAGYTMQPSQVIGGKPIGGITSRLLERGGGKASIPAEASLRNQQVTNKLVSQELGLPTGELITPASLNRLRTEANVAYRELQNLKAPIDLVADQQYLAGLAEIRQGSVSRLRGGQADPRIDTLTKALEQPGGVVDIRSIMDEIEQLRFDSRKNYLSDDPNTARLGAAQRQAAMTLEDALERGVSPIDPAAVQRFRDARVRLAKIHTVEDALKGSDVDARVLARARQSGTPLTGGLATVADVADYFPQVVQTNPRLGSVSGAGLLDVALSVPTLGLWALGREGAKRAALRTRAVSETPIGDTIRAGRTRNALARGGIAMGNALQTDENGRPIINALVR